MFVLMIVSDKLTWKLLFRVQCGSLGFRNC